MPQFPNVDLHHNAPRHEVRHEDGEPATWKDKAVHEWHKLPTLRGVSHDHGKGFVVSVDHSGEAGARAKAAGVEAGDFPDHKQGGDDDDPASEIPVFGLGKTPSNTASPKKPEETFWSSDDESSEELIDRGVVRIKQYGPAPRSPKELTEAEIAKIAKVNQMILDRKLPGQEAGDAHERNKKKKRKQAAKWSLGILLTLAVLGSAVAVVLAKPWAKNGAAGPKTLRRSGFYGDAVKIDVITLLADEGVELDSASVVIGLRDGSAPSETSLKIDGQGTWTVDPATGVVTFTPEPAIEAKPAADGQPAIEARPAFNGQPESIAYTVKGSADEAGNQAVFGASTITVTYFVEPRDIEFTPDASVGPSDVVSVDVVGDDGELLDASTVEIGIGDAWGHNLDLGVQGLWMVNKQTGEVSFTPGAGLTVNPVPVAYRIKRKDDGDYVSALIRIEYTGRAKTVRTQATQIVVPGNPGTDDAVAINVADHLTAGTYTPDLTSIRILGVLSLDPDPRAEKKQGSLSQDEKTLTVTSEGTWAVGDGTEGKGDVGTIVYTPNAGNTAAPQPIVWTIVDTAMIPSAANGTIIINKTLNDIENDTLVIAADDGPDDVAFWTSFEQEVTDDPHVSIAFLLGIVQTLINDTYFRLGPNNPERVKLVTPINALATAQMQSVSWQQLPTATASEVYAVAVAQAVGSIDVDTVSTDISTIPFATRYSRLNWMKIVARDWLAKNPPPPASLEFKFESTDANGFVDALGDSALFDGTIASQDAGSTNAGLFYQIKTSADGAGALNGIFGDRLSAAGDLDRVNAELAKCYDSVFGNDTFGRDSVATPPPDDNLTSLLVGLEPGAQTGTKTGDKVAAVVYSVGPVLGAAGLTDEAGYRKLYYEAYERIAAYNETALNPILGLRVTMLSSGIYANSVTDKVALRKALAKNIILGIAEAAHDFGMYSGGFVVLINSDGDAATSDQRTSFAAAATELSIEGATAEGFTADLGALKAK